MQNYDHAKIEKKWQREWLKESKGTKDVIKGKKNHYLLAEFPYPSGNLHVGHWYAFALPDIYARYMRAKGNNVLYPIGFDAFGLPAENAAIKRGLNPRKWTYANMTFMKKQFASMGGSFDWSREVVTCDPAYYRWTQWQFLQFFKKGLAYQKETPANWCPSCKTVLANEQLVSGKCERCGSEVEQRTMLQWNLAITKYADRLIDDLDKLDWPEQIKEAQKNWIGRSEGSHIDFKIKGTEHTMTVFTTRADTLFGVTYVVLAPEHVLVAELRSKASNKEEIEAYIAATKRKTDLERQENKEKTGVELKSVTAINPANGEEVPVYIADYVLAHYGTGAVMAVPAHDERDFEFAKKFNLPVKEVVAPFTVYEPKEGKKTEERDLAVAIVRNPKDDTYLCLDWQTTSWKSFPAGGTDGDDYVTAAQREVLEETGYKHIVLVKEYRRTLMEEFYRPHKDSNVIARYKYLVFDLVDDERVEVSEKERNQHNAVWVKKNEVADFLNISHLKIFWANYIGEKEEGAYIDFGRMVDSGKFSGMNSVVAKKAITEFVGGRLTNTYRLRDWGVSRQRYWGVPIPIIHCPACGAMPVPDKDLPVKLPEIKDYLPTGDGKSPLAKVSKWVNVRCPQCKGKAQRETDTLDTFVDSSWYYLRYTDPKNTKKFADRKKQDNWMPVDLYSGGSEHTTMHLLYSRFWHKALYDLKLVKEKEPYKKRMNRGLILGPDGQKMSKSKGNVIDPDSVVAQFGADTVRLYLAFIGPYNEPGSYPWNPNSIVGVRRFLERVWKLKDNFVLKPVVETDRELHKTIAKLTDDIPQLKYNTAVAQMMIFVNTAEKYGITEEEYSTLLRILAPFAPHIAEDLWHQLGNKKSIHAETWPKFSPKKLIKDTITLAVQVNGKVRDTIIVAAGAEEDEVRKIALASEKVHVWVGNGEPKKVIYVKGRLINIVV